MEDKYLKEHFSSLQNHEVEPNQRIWRQIEGHLRTERKRHFQHKFNIAVAAALVIIFSIIAIQIFSKPDPTPQTALEHPTQNQQDTLRLQDSIGSPE